MEKRFTLKDFFLFAAVATVLVTLLVTMYMIDRQWLMMSRMRATIQEQAEDLRALRTDLKALDQRVASGALAAARAAAAPTDSTAAPPDTPGTAPVFERALAATRLPGYASGDWLVRAFGVGLSTITPLVSQDAYASDVQGYVQESLLSRNPDTLAWEGLVAHSWGISEDGLTITFRLRDGVTFSDGRPLRADDVAFTFAFIMNEAIAAPRHRAYLEKIESVEAIAPLVVVFRFREPYFNALALAGSMEVMPRHFYEPYLREPATFNESKGLLLGSGRSVASAAASARAVARDAWPRPPPTSSSMCCPSNPSASGCCRSPSRYGSCSRPAPQCSPRFWASSTGRSPPSSCAAPDCAQAPARAPAPSPSSSASDRRSTSTRTSTCSSSTAPTRSMTKRPGSTASPVASHIIS